MTAIQTELSLDGHPGTYLQAFEEWVHTPGGRKIAREAYRRAAGFAKRWERTGQRVSIRYIWYGIRDHVAGVSRRAKLLRVDLAKWDGYALNDHFTAYLARHMIANRPEWDGLFELREIGKPKKLKRVIVIQERKAS